jgi:hypothetical protein
VYDAPPSVLLGAEDLPLLPWSEQGDDLSINQFNKRYNQCYGSGTFILDPDFYPSRISDLGSNNSNKRGGGKYLLSCLFL